MTSRDIVQKMVDNDGTYPGDPPCKAIYEYNYVDRPGLAWAIIYVEADEFSLATSPFVKEMRLLWHENVGKILDTGQLEGGNGD